MRARSIGLACFLFFTLGAFPGCGGDDAEDQVNLGECPPDSSAQQAEGEQALQSCTACHSTTRTGAARLDAPVGVDLDDPDYVSSQPGAIYKAVSDGAMPPGAPLPAATVESIRVYLACGAP